MIFFAARATSTCGVESGVGCGGNGTKVTGEEVAEDPAPEVVELAGEMMQ